jgi:general L-amino acid transport system substrate-binding protein
LVFFCFRKPLVEEVSAGLFLGILSKGNPQTINKIREDGMKLLKAGIMLMLAAAVFVIAPAVSARAGDTLSTVKARGYILVGVNGGLYGFGMPDEKGVWHGLDVDTARAISTGIFGTPDKVKFVTLTTQTRFTALQSKEIDVLCRNATGLWFRKN